jgi:solute carrier family 29 (equilibrative nucleoside transporter), member 1/2/3
MIDTSSLHHLVLITDFNVSDLVGRYLTLIKQVKVTSRKRLLIAVISRFLLIPAFHYTAKYGGQGWKIMLTSFLGLSNGHLTVCVLTEAPKGYKVGLRFLNHHFCFTCVPAAFANVSACLCLQGPEQNALGNLLVLFLLAGIFCGAVSDWLWLIGKGW